MSTPSPVRTLHGLTDAFAAGEVDGAEVERVLGRVVAACLDGLDGELRDAWGRALRGHCDASALRHLARWRESLAAEEDAPPGVLAGGFAATALLHARHALAVVRAGDARLSVAATYRLRHSLQSAYQCAQAAAEFTLHGDALRVQVALRDALTERAAA